MTEEEAIEQTHAALQADRLRVEFGTERDRYGEYPTATLYTKAGQRWKQTGPVLVTDPGGSRADLFNMLRMMLEALNAPEETDGDPQGEVHPE